MAFPVQLPATIEPIVAALCEQAMVDPGSTGRMRSISSWVPTLATTTVGLEVAVDDPGRGCDLALLTDMARSPLAAETQSPMLREFAAAAERVGQSRLWWEFDTSNGDVVSEGAFVKASRSAEGWEVLRRAVADDRLLAAAVERTAMMCTLIGGDGDGLVGVFPSRAIPAVGAMRSLPPSAVPAVLARLRTAGVLAPDPDDDVLRHLLPAVDRAAISLCIDTQDRTAAGVEVAFADPTGAMRARRWDPLLSSLDHLGQERAEAFAPLLSMQGVHVFSGALPLALFRGISHVKVSPGAQRSTVKAYIGGALRWVAAA